MSGKDVRVTIPGHTQRGGIPCPEDRILASRLGSAAADYIITGKSGVMAALVNGRIVSVPLEDIAGKLKTVDVLSDEILEAKSLGISFGE